MNPVYAFKDTSKSVPPEDVDYVKVDLKETGSRFAEYCRHLARLQPGDRILDVDCGLGPLAVALTGYLDSTARYEGIDVVSSGNCVVRAGDHLARS